MPKYAYDRLSAQDCSFLQFEDANHPMHVGAALILEEGDLKKPNGGIDVERYKQAIASVLHRIPRYRQKLKWTPLENHPVWVDDRHFSLDYHIRHSSLPKPGTLRQLKELTARILTRQLDRSRPLWEIWVVEGLQGERFALISKIHHCMLDGMAGADISQILLSPDSESTPTRPPRFIPRPAPGAGELLAHSVMHRASLPLLAAGRAAGQFVRAPSQTTTSLMGRVRALKDLAGWAITPASATPINAPLGPNRRVEWLTLPLELVRRVKRELGVTVNDIVLATVTGAVRDYMIRRGVDPRRIDFRVSAPVNMRSAEERGELGNRVSSWILRLPIDHSDPAKQLQLISQRTRRLKDSDQALAVDSLMKMAEVAPSSAMALISKAAALPINMIVTNVPGPQFPLYLLGAKLEAPLPFVPLIENTGLGVALFSYDGKLCWGLNADYDLVPDLETFREFVLDSFNRIIAGTGLLQGEFGSSAKTLDYENTDDDPMSVVGNA